MSELMLVSIAALVGSLPCLVWCVYKNGHAFYYNVLATACASGYGWY